MYEENDDDNDDDNHGSHARDDDLEPFCFLLSSDQLKAEYDKRLRNVSVINVWIFVVVVVVREF